MKCLILYVTSTLLLAVDKILPVVANGNGRFQQPLRYHANEESEENTIIGDVRKDYNKNLHKMIAEITNMPDATQQRSTFTFAFLKSSNQKFFKIDKITGIVKTTSARMDREAICSSNETCTIETDVIIYSHSNPQSMVKVFIEVVDINDNKPTFPMTSISETISEIRERGVIVFVNPATDKDSSKFGVVRYLLRDAFGGLFEVDLIEGGFKKESQVTIYLKGTLDRESKDFYALELIASDGGIPPNTGSMFIDLIVSDENDNLPVFQNLPYYLEIPENTIVFNFFKVQADDKDLDLNGKVEYHFSTESSFRYKDDFSINKMTGSLELLRPLDFEISDIAVLTIIANDLGSHRHSSTTSLTVSVIDMNDNAPQIDIIDINQSPLTTIQDVGQRLVTIKENSSPGSVVVSLHVIDLDSGMGGLVQCEVDSRQDVFEVIKISTNDFDLVTSSLSNLDREIKERHSIVVVCKDSDVNNPLSSSIDIVIDLIDVNDNPPFIPGCPKEFQVEEGNEPDHQIGIITAYDIDKSDNSTIEYSITKRRHSDVFDIHPKHGVLTVLVTLDREAKDKYDLELIVTDEGHLHSKCDVAIKVTDVEDCDPEFEQSEYFFQIHGEHFNPLHPIGQVRAVDRDSAPANLISYNIVNEIEYLEWYKNDTTESDVWSNHNRSVVRSMDAIAGENIFDIKSNSGLIYTAKPLRRSLANRSHFILLVMATSGINRMASTTADIHIDISQGRNRNMALSSQLQEINDLSHDGNSETELEESKSENGMQYLKIPLLLGLTCVLVGMTVFVAIIIMQAICSKLSRPQNSMLFSSDKRTSPPQHKANDCNGLSKTSQQESNMRLNLSKVLNLTHNIVKPIFLRNRAEQTPDKYFDEGNDQDSKVYDKRQNYLLDSLVTSTSSASSQSLLYSPRHVSLYKPSLDPKADMNDAYRTNTLPINKDRRSSGYYSPTRSTFSSNDDNGDLVRYGSRKSADSGRMENRKLSIDLNQYEINKQPVEQTSTFRLFDSQKSSTFHGSSKVHMKLSSHGNEDKVFNTDFSSNQKLGRFLWYHDV